MSRHGDTRGVRLKPEKREIAEEGGDAMTKRSQSRGKPLRRRSGDVAVDEE